MVNVAAARPTRADYYKVLAENLPPQALVVTSLGNASYLWAKVHEAPENFYFEDAMGLALPLSLGLAIAQPCRAIWRRAPPACRCFRSKQYRRRAPIAQDPAPHWSMPDRRRRRGRRSGR